MLAWTAVLFSNALAGAGGTGEAGQTGGVPAVIQIDDWIDHPARWTGWILIDARDPAAHRAACLPQSIFLTAAQIRSGQLPPAQGYALVGWGWDAVALRQLALLASERSRRPVGILDGGIRQWALAGHPLEGESPHRLTTAMIEPAVAARLERGRWLWIGLCSGSGPAHAKAPAGFDPLIYWQDGESLLHTIAAKATVVGEEGLVLLASSQGEYYEQIEQAAGKYTQLRVYYLRGGWRAWQEQERLESGLRRRERVTQRDPRAGATANQPDHYRPPATSPCANCP